MQIARSKTPNVVPSALDRRAPPPSCERSPRAGLLPEKAPLYRVVLGCTLVMARPHTEARSSGH